MNDETRNKIHNLLYKEGMAFGQVHATLETKMRGNAFVARIGFLPRSQGQSPLAHNIFEQVTLFIYYDNTDFDADFGLIGSLLRELKDAYLWVEGAEFGRTGHILATKIVPELRQSTLSLSLFLDNGSLYCEGFLDWHGLLIDGIDTPLRLWHEVLYPRTMQHGLFLLMATLSAQEQLW